MCPQHHGGFLFQPFKIPSIKLLSGSHHSQHPERLADSVCAGLCFGIALAPSLSTLLERQGTAPYINPQLMLEYFELGSGITAFKTSL